jgi:hypothetical protein
VISPQTLRTGDVARCGTGDWLRGPASFGYQWTRGGTNIAGATGAAYTTTAADENKVVGCRVHASNGEGTGQARTRRRRARAAQGRRGRRADVERDAAGRPRAGAPCRGECGQVQVPVGCAAQVQRCTGDVQLQANVAAPRHPR